MVLQKLTIKSILLILNSLNIVRSIIAIILALVTTENDPIHSMFLNYITMLLSAICCAAVVMESFIILQISANIFLSEMVATVVLWIYIIDLVPLNLYNFFVLVLHGIIIAVAYYMAERIQMAKLNNLISKYTGVAAIPLNPPPQVRADVI